MTTTITPSIGHAPLIQQAGTGTTPGYDAVDLRRLATAGLQEGVMAAGSYMVTQRGAGANMSVDIAASTGDDQGSGVAALVQGDAVGFQGLYPVPPHSAVINETLTTAHASLPRVDRIILEIQDNTHDASGGNLVRTRVLTGTATSGANLDNLTGATAVPSSALLLADIQINAAQTTTPNSLIRDRRRWARGGFRRIARNANASSTNNYTVSSGGNMALVDGTNLYPRIECSGVPLRVTLACTWEGNAVSVQTFWGLAVDGSGTDGAAGVGVAPGTNALILTGDSSSGGDSLACISWVIVPSAGSHRIGPTVACTIGDLIIKAQSTLPVVLTVEEVLRQDSANNSVTTG